MLLRLMHTGVYHSLFFLIARHKAIVWVTAIYSSIYTLMAVWTVSTAQVFEKVAINIPVQVFV